MPVKLEMTWDFDNRRWRKLHRGRRYVVSCRQLGVPETKEASFRAANEWWERKLAEVEALQPPSPHQPVVDELRRREAWSRRHDPGSAGLLAAEIREVSGLGEGELHPSLAREGYLGSPSARAVWADRLARQPEELVPREPHSGGPGPPGGWEGQEARVKAGAMAPGSLRNNSDCIKRFREFAGEGMPVGGIDEDLIERFFGHLLGEIGEVSKAYAMKCFGVARAFIRYAVERGLVPQPPGTLDKRVGSVQPSPPPPGPGRSRTLNARGVPATDGACDRPDPAAPHADGKLRHDPRSTSPS